MMRRRLGVFAVVFLVYCAKLGTCLCSLEAALLTAVISRSSYEL